MRERDWDRMNDVVALMRDGGELYRNAAERIAAPDLAALCRENAAARAAAADNLARELGAPGRAAPIGGPEFRLAGAPDPEEPAEDAMLAELDAHEDRVRMGLAIAINGLPDDALSSRALLIAHATLAEEFAERFRTTWLGAPVGTREDPPRAEA